MQQEGCSFRQYLELCPEVRELLSDFYTSRYPSCLKTLSRLSSELVYDIHLSSHLKPLEDKIRSRALIQYTSAYVKVDLNLMAAAFNTELRALEDEVAALIADGRISYRIDSENKHLVARDKETALRAVTFGKTVGVGEDALKAGKLMMLRTNLQRNKFLMRPQQQDRRGRGGRDSEAAAAEAMAVASGGLPPDPMAVSWAAGENDAGTSVEMEMEGAGPAGEIA